MKLSYDALIVYHQIQVYATQIMRAQVSPTAGRPTNLLAALVGYAEQLIVR